MKRNYVVTMLVLLLAAFSLMDVNAQDCNPYLSGRYDTRAARTQIFTGANGATVTITHNGGNNYSWTAGSPIAAIHLLERSGTIVIPVDPLATSGTITMESDPLFTFCLEPLDCDAAGTFSIASEPGAGNLPTQTVIGSIDAEIVFTYVSHTQTSPNGCRETYDVIYSWTSARAISYINGVEIMPAATSGTLEFEMTYQDPECFELSGWLRENFEFCAAPLDCDDAGEYTLSGRPEAGNVPVLTTPGDVDAGLTFVFDSSTLTGSSPGGFGDGPCLEDTFDVIYSWESDLPIEYINGEAIMPPSASGSLTLEMIESSQNPLHERQCGSLGWTSVTLEFCASNAPADPGCGDYLFLGKDDVKIAAPAYVEGNIHANDDLYIRRGRTPNSAIDGNLSAVDDMEIRDRNIINGDANVGDDLDNDGTINGAINVGVTVDPVPFPTLAPFTAGSVDVDVEAGAPQTLAPGSYEDVDVERNAMLTLTAGEYFFYRLELGQESELYFDLSGGPVVVNVVRKLDFGQGMEVTSSLGESGSSMITFNSLQTSTLYINREATVIGSIVAPEATVKINSYANFRGSICGEDVDAHCAVGTLLHHNASANLPKDRDSYVHDEAIADMIPETFSLDQNYPNPFNPSTTIRFNVAQDGLSALTNVKLAIYDITGREVRTLVDNNFAAGSYSVQWDATNNRGEKVAGGIYLYRISAGKFSQTKKMILMK